MKEILGALRCSDTPILVVGPEGSGKSSIIRAMAVIFGYVKFWNSMERNKGGGEKRDVSIINTLFIRVRNNSSLRRGKR